MRTLIDAGATVDWAGPRSCPPCPRTARPSPCSRSTTPAPPAVHEVEAFGRSPPVLGYSGDVRGTPWRSPPWAASVPWWPPVCAHSPSSPRSSRPESVRTTGRVLFLDRDDARTSTGTARQCPAFVHGGPAVPAVARSWAGARVKRCIAAHRRAGLPDLLTGITGQWRWSTTANTVTREDVENGAGEHPFRKSLETLRSGASSSRTLRTVKLEDILEFARSR
ncbi:hypothetical protein QJS66_16570 [Kocuria rhizophila]|nr:hypothetical protein QJS66_16570 [Kocuria rhizophila]